MKETSISSATSLTSETTSNDSVYVEKNITPIVVPPSKVELTVSPDDLEKLPSGASFSDKQGNAGATVTKNPDNSLTFTANCDSLILLVESIKKEVYHFRQENTALKSRLDKQEVKIIKEPSGWQWFQIYGFWILLSINLLLVIFKFSWKTIKTYLKIN